jgi:hypothetical protein
LGTNPRWKTLTEWNLGSSKGEIELTIRFYPSKVKKVIEEVITRNLQGREYDDATAKDLAMDIANQIKTATKGN